jgi:hypothetical protein
MTEEFQSMITLGVFSRANKKPGQWDFKTMDMKNYLQGCDAKQ